MADIVSMVDEGSGTRRMSSTSATGACLVLDPTRAPGGYLAVAERRGVEIAYAVETHLHADFVSASRELVVS